jgi:hypothetical protein
MVRNEWRYTVILDVVVKGKIPTSRQDLSLQLYVQRVHAAFTIILTAGYFPRAETAGE